MLYLYPYTGIPLVWNPISNQLVVYGTRIVFHLNFLKGPLQRYSVPTNFGTDIWAYYYVAIVVALFKYVESDNLLGCCIPHKCQQNLCFCSWAENPILAM